MMRINEVNIPKDFEDNGLEDIKMQRLGQIVVLVGKNGAGKTRIFEKINNASFKWPSPKLVTEYTSKIKWFDEGNRDGSINQDQINIYKKTLTYQTFFKADEDFRPMNYVPKGTQLLDPDKVTKRDIKSSSISVGNPGSIDLRNSVLLHIQHVQDLFFETYNPAYTDEKKKQQIKEDYFKLCELIRMFLNSEIGRTDAGEATLFERKIGEAKLSDGQSILLQLISATFRQEWSLKHNILFLDEPENHMHPSAIIEALKKIIEATKESQVWIATHSLPIIAYLASLPETSIYYVEDGKVSFAGSTPEKVLEGLLGDEEQIGKLHDFIGLPAQYAINLYAYQCLFEPAVVETGADDPQTNQIKDVLDSLRKGKSLKLLDYGAGKGRLLANIVETNKDLLQSLDYVAFDKFDSNKNHCEGVIASAYGDRPNSYYNSMTDLKAVHRGSFDIVLMCNVLHEIPPSEWLNLMKSITDLLNENGGLLIVEDSQIPIGEKAHQHGFIVFDEAQIRELFAIGAATDFLSQSHSKNSRLKAHLIPKKYLSNISDETRKAAIKSLNEKAKEEINKLRGLDPKSLAFKQGREHAFWVQQFANTQLALDAM